ncbi:hypothetical protein LCGC14_1264140 [marine sediment metagenome]|uniref:Uncharacterized protein n=1 Tax=marine sediment metagenome TaxID=412755 RepID=A0A0F9L296_9ZZZZ
MVEQAEKTDGTVTSPSSETSEEQPVTFTQEQLDAAVRKSTSDALATAGREAKTLEETRKANAATLKSLNERETTLRRATETAENATARASEDPDAYKNLEARRDTQRREDAIVSDRAALDERERTVTAAASVINATKIAAESKVDAETLLKFTDGTEDAMKELALQLQTPEAAPATTITPDPGTGSGGVKEQAPRTALDNAKRILEVTMANPSHEKSKAM